MVDAEPAAAERRLTVVSEQFKSLIFTMQDAWPVIHARGSDLLRREWTDLTRPFGDFAETPAQPSDTANVRLYQALRESAPLVLDLAWASKALRDRYSRTLRDNVILDARIRRLAFVNEWSDAFLERAIGHIRALPDQVLQALQQAADDLALAELRGGVGCLLTQRAAVTLGFDSASEFSDFRRAHPPLSQAMKARPASSRDLGGVVEASLLEVVMDVEGGLAFFERSKLLADPVPGDWVEVSGIGQVRLASADAARAEPLQALQQRPTS